MRVKFFAEMLGTFFLVMIVLGSGIMAQTLFPNQTGSALLVNSLATGAGLFVLIQSLGHISGAHFNPIVSVAEFVWKGLSAKELFCYICAHFFGAYCGVLSTHFMFDHVVFELSTIDRSGNHLLYSEFVASFGLICVIALARKKHVEFAPLSVAAYITSAYWFTSSTSFVNPAVTFARLFTNSFGGMSADHFFGFVVFQFLGASVGYVILRLSRLSK